MARVTWNGNPGEVFTNDTDRVLYQFIVNWRNSCGTCAQLDHAIGPYWPIPYHRNCRCQQRPVLPGRSADPYVDYREEIRQLDPHQQAAVMGRSNWQLVESGVVDFSDVVTPTRVRDLREVVALNGLSVEQLTEAGVGRRIAEQAYQSVNTPEHRLIARKQAELVAALRAKGLSARQIKEAVGQRVAQRVGVAGKTPVPSLSGAVAKRLGIRPIPGVPILPDRPIAERLAAYTEGDRKVKAVSDLDTRFAARAAAYESEAARLGIRLNDLVLEQIDLIDRGLGGTPRFDEIQVEMDRLATVRDGVWKQRSDLAGERRQAVFKLLQSDQSQEIVSKQVVSPWVEPLIGKNPATVDEAIEFVAKLLRQGTNPGTFEIRVGQIPATDEQRAHWVGYVAIGDDEEVKTVVHEMGHAIEEMLPNGGRTIKERSLEFLGHRVGGETLVKLKDLFPRSNYKDNEFGRKDKFDQAFTERQAYYVGKDYGKGGTEIFSMGLEKLFSDPVGFAAKDPEYFKFVVGILDGSLR